MTLAKSPQAENLRSFTGSLTRVFQENFPSLPLAKSWLDAGVRPSRCASESAYSVYLCSVVTSIREGLEGVGGPLDEEERRSLRTKLWDLVHEVPSGAGSTDEPSEIRILKLRPIIESLGA